MLLRTVFEKQFYPLRLYQRAKGTQRHYQLAMKNFEQYLERPAVLADLNDLNVAAMMVMLSRRGLDPQTVNSRRKCLVAFWNWCAKKGLVKTFPDVEKHKEEPVEPKAWSKAELARLFGACSYWHAPVGLVPGSTYWQAIHLWWWDTGERTGATLAVRWDAIDLETGIAFVPGSIRKGGKSATYRLKESTVESLALMRAFSPGTERVFDWPYNRQTFYNRYRRLLQLAGLPTGRRCKPQKMRRSYASHLEAAGGNATDALQHSSRSVTETSYIDRTIARRAEPNELLFDPRKSNGDTGGA